MEIKFSLFIFTIWHGCNPVKMFARCFIQSLPIMDACHMALEKKNRIQMSKKRHYDRYDFVSTFYDSKLIVPQYRCSEQIKAKAREKQKKYVEFSLS